MTTTAFWVVILSTILAIARVHGTIVSTAVIWANSPPSIVAGWAPTDCAQAGIPASATFQVGDPVIVYGGPPCPPAGCQPVLHGAKAYCFTQQVSRTCSGDWAYNGPIGSNDQPAEQLSAGQSLAPGCGIRDNGCRYRGAIQTQVYYRGWAANMGDGVARTTSNPGIHCADVMTDLQWPSSLLELSLSALHAGTTWVATRPDPTLELTVSDWDGMNRMGLYNMFALMSWPEMDQVGCSQFNGGHPEGASNICYQNLHAAAGVNQGEAHAGYSIEITGPCGVKWDPDVWTDFLLDNAVAVSGSLQNNNWGCYSNPCPIDNVLNIPMPNGYVRAACIDQFSNSVQASALEGAIIAQTWAQCLQTYGAQMRGACAVSVVPAGIQIPCPPSKVACRGGQVFSEWDGVRPANATVPPTPGPVTTTAAAPTTSTGGMTSTSTATAATTTAPAPTSGTTGSPAPPPLTTATPTTTPSTNTTAATTTTTAASSTTTAVPTTTTSVAATTTAAAPTSTTAAPPNTTTASSSTTAAAPPTTTSTAAATTAAATTTTNANTTASTLTTAATTSSTTTTTASPSTTTAVPNNCSSSLTCSDCFTASGGICHWGNNGTGPNECSGPENPPPFVVGCGSGSGSGTGSPVPPPPTTTADNCMSNLNCSSCLGASCLWGYNATGYMSCKSTAQAGTITSCNVPACNSGNFSTCGACDSVNCGWCNSTASCQDSQFQCTGGGVWTPFPDQC